MQNPPITVFTALYGQYEELVEQPITQASGARFVCFTDNPKLTSDTWEVRFVKPSVPGDSVRSARKIKILGYRGLGTDVTMWIDNRVVLKTLPETLAEAYLREADIALPSHDHRESVAAEFDEVISAGLDVPWRVRHQLQFLGTQAPHVLSEVPFWTAILLRRNTPELASAMDLWWDQVALFSRRDQLSINFALNETGTLPQTIGIPNTESIFHVWLRADKLPKRNDVYYGRAYNYSLSMHVRDAIMGGKFILRLRNKIQRTRWALASRRSVPKS